LFFGVRMKYTDLSKLVVAVILSILFTLAFFYLTFELPRILDELLHNFFPDVFWQRELREQVIDAMRPYGYLTLTITLILIVVGFAVKKGYLSILCSITMYLPIFGYFAFAMFFLAGIGVLRVLWLALLEVSPTLLKLGYAVYLPFLFLKLVPDGYNWYSLVQLIALITTGLGILIFSLGVTTWLYGKFKGYKIADFWIYKYSRHPQYLGFLLWSYGLLLFIGFQPYTKGAFSTPPTLIWLISSIIVIGVALYEELEMRNRFGEEYINYCKKTPFTLPLPKLLSDFIMAPSKLLIKGPPRNRMDIAIILTVYATILIALSYLLLLIFRL